MFCENSYPADTQHDNSDRLDGVRQILEVGGGGGDPTFDLNLYVCIYLFCFQQMFVAWIICLPILGMVKWQEWNELITNTEQFVLK